MPDILLPGMSHQYNHILKLTVFKGKNICIFGGKSTPIASMFLKRQALSVSVIVADEEDLLRDRASEWLKTGTQLKLMEYKKTDFADNSFDYLYAQASLVNTERKAVLKEMYRILQPGGELSLGDLVQLQQLPPVFANICKSSGMKLFSSEMLISLITEAGFVIKDTTDITPGLTSYYKTQLDFLEAYEAKLSAAEKKEVKKELTPYKHEAKTYLQSKGASFIGMSVFHCTKPVLTIK